MNMLATIVPKSDQISADDLIGRTLTITITEVAIKPGAEQPVTVFYEGGRPYRPCKSMCRVMVACWGLDANAYVGRSMTLYRDPKVKWGGLEVGGIRISHLSHLDGARTMALTETKGSKKPFVVKPLAEQAPQKLTFSYLDAKLAQCASTADLADLIGHDPLIGPAKDRPQVKERIDARYRELAVAEEPTEEAPADEWAPADEQVPA